MPSILADSQMLPGCTVVFSNGNDTFGRYRAMSGMFRQASDYDQLAILNKHKLTDDDYKTGVLTRFTREALAGARHEVLWLASNVSLTAWDFQDVCHVVHYDLGRICF